MRIAMVSPYSWAHPGGVNNHVAGLAAEMVKRRHEVTIIAPDGGDPVPGATLLSAGRSIPLPANGSIARLALLPSTRDRVRDAVARGGFDVVHVHEPLVPLVSTSAVAAAPCRVVGTFHAAGEGRSVTYELARQVLKRTSARLDSRIAVSPAARALAARYFPGDYEVIPNGVDLSRFFPGLPTPDAFAGDGPAVLFVGRNERRKGLDVLLEAFPSVVEAVPDCRLVVVGEGYGAGKPSLPTRLADRVTVLGFVQNDELPAYYGAADVFCAPALGGESFGVVLIEAMACGTPVLASDIPGYRDVLEQSGGGRLFGVGDPCSLAGALVELLGDAALRRRLAETGLAAVGRYSWENLGDRLEASYMGEAI